MDESVCDLRFQCACCGHRAQTLRAVNSFYLCPACVAVGGDPCRCHDCGAVALVTRTCLRTNDAGHPRVVHCCVGCAR